MARTLHAEMTEYGLHAAKVRGAVAVQYKEGKRKYVCTSEDFKVSGADSKRYDKRWDEVCPWMDGSFTAVVGLLKIGRSSLLCMWNSLVEVARKYEDVTGNNAQNPWQHLDWLHWNWQTGGRAEEAFKSLKLACQAVVDRDNARRVLECYHSNVENDNRLAAERDAERAKKAEVAA